jgi:hypothetical protein
LDHADADLGDHAERPPEGARGYAPVIVTGSEYTPRVRCPFT